MHQMDETPKLYGLLAEFDSPTAIVTAARKARDAGYVKLDAYTPYPIHELDAALKLPRTILPWLVFGGGVTGLLAGLALEYWTSVVDYPLNIGGRPLASWTTFIVPSYELTILFASLTAAIGMALLSGLPQPYHPVFNVDRFSMASSDKFFLVIESTDPKFGDATNFLHGTGAKGVYDVAE